MENQLKDRYDALNAAMAIDLSQIDDVLVRCSQLMQDAGELSAEATFLERCADLAFDVVTAQVSSQMRSEGVDSGRKQRSEANITSELPMNTEYQQARNARDQARFDSDMCKSLASSMRERVKAAIKAGDLIQSGHISMTAAVYRDRFNK